MDLLPLKLIDLADVVLTENLNESRDAIAENATVYELKLV